MLIYGAMFACVSPLVSIAALLSSRNPFVAPMDKYVSWFRCRMFRYDNGDVCAA
jgi:hypothetical protein